MHTCVSKLIPMSNFLTTKPKPEPPLLTTTAQDTETLARRIRTRQRMMLRHPDTIPVEVILDKSCDFELPQRKLMVRKDMTVGEFISLLRLKMKLKPEEATFILMNNTIPKISASMSDMYEEHMDEAQVLSCVICKENTFG